MSATVVEPRYAAAEVRVAGQWRHAILDTRERTIVNYVDTEQLAIRTAAGLNAEEARKEHRAGGPLAVLRAVAACQEGHQGHDLDLITDGVKGYAWGATSDAVIVRREGTILVATCNQPDSDEQPCDHEVRFELDLPCWTSEPAALDMLAAYGARIPS